MLSTHPCYHQPQFCYFAFLIPPPPLPFTFTHWESGGWFAAHRMAGHQVEGSPVFSLSVALAAEHSDMFGMFDMVQ